MGTHRVVNTRVLFVFLHILWNCECASACETALMLVLVGNLAEADEKLAAAQKESAREREASKLAIARAVDTGLQDLNKNISDMLVCWLLAWLA